MKKNMYKILAGVLVVGVAGYLYHKSQNKKTSLMPTVSTDVKKSIPTEFEVVIDKALQTTNKFWTDGKTFFKQTFGPMIKSTPEVISEAQYVKEYAA